MTVWGSSNGFVDMSVDKSSKHVFGNGNPLGTIGSLSGATHTLSIINANGTLTIDYFDVCGTPSPSSAKTASVPASTTQATIISSSLTDRSSAVAASTTQSSSVEANTSAVNSNLSSSPSQGSTTSAAVSSVCGLE